MKHFRVASRDTAPLEWQLRREADKCSAGQNPWRNTRWKCKIKTCMKSLPEAEFRSVTPQDWATHKISHRHPTSTGAHRVKARFQHQDQHYFLGFFDRKESMSSREMHRVLLHFWNFPPNWSSFRNFFRTHFPPSPQFYNLMELRS